MVMDKANTVEPLYSGHLWDRNYWPDNQGGHISGVNSYTYVCNLDKQYVAIMATIQRFGIATFYCTHHISSHFCLTCNSQTVSSY